MRRLSPAIISFLILAAIATYGDAFWAKKDWKEWSKGECDKLLQDSPWARKWTKTQVILSSAVPSVSGAGREGAAGENTPEIDYRVQVLSALPVREAEIRQEQIESKYDQMSDVEKKAFDAHADKVLSPPYDDFILIHVEYSSNLQRFERQLARYWQSLPPDTIPLGVYIINERGDHIGPVRWISPRSGTYEFEMYFPRTMKGEPVIKPGDKKFSVQFRHPRIGSQAVGNPSNDRNTTVPRFGGELVLVEFKLDAMMWKGKLTY